MSLVELLTALSVGCGNYRDQAFSGRICSVSPARTDTVARVECEPDSTDYKCYWVEYERKGWGILLETPGGYANVFVDDETVRKRKLRVGRRFTYDAKYWIRPQGREIKKTKL